MHYFTTRRNHAPPQKEGETKVKKYLFHPAGLLAIITAVAILAGSAVPGAAQGGPKKTDSLYIGDAKDNTVQRYDVPTRDFGGTFVTSNSGGLNGPRGMIFDHDGNLLIANQNVDSPVAGEILRYNGKTGAFMGALVPSSDPDAPFAPRGIVLGTDNTLYVADFIAGDNVGAGRVARYDGASGVFLGNLDATGYAGPYHPRGLVFGPDGLLYVSTRSTTTGLGGGVLRFNPATRLFVDVFVVSDGTNDLNRPEGLVFGPDGNLYITSFRADAFDTDKVLAFAGPGSMTPGAYVVKIDLAAPEALGGRRAFAQAILFGPGGLLYVPITGNDPQTTGQVRRYNVSTGGFDLFATSAHLGQPWYLTFGKTDPATLAYHD